MKLWFEANRCEKSHTKVILDGKEYNLMPSMPDNKTDKTEETTSKVPTRTCAEAIQEAIDTKRGHDNLLDSDGNRWQLRLVSKASNIPNTFDADAPHAKRFVGHCAASSGAWERARPAGSEAQTGTAAREAWP